MLPIQETAIFKALADLRKYEKNELQIIQTYYGQAYKGNKPEGVIGYCLLKQWINELTIPDDISYFFIYRHGFYNRWRDRCIPFNLGKRYNEGFTLSAQIYEDMDKLSQLSRCELLVGNCSTLLRFRPEDIINFVTEHMTHHTHEIYNVREVGIPTLLCYKKENFR
jgi:hypothetical protein